MFSVETALKAIAAAERREDVLIAYGRYSLMVDTLAAAKSPEAKIVPKFDASAGLQAFDGLRSHDRAAAVSHQIRALNFKRLDSQTRPIWLDAFGGADGGRGVYQWAYTGLARDRLNEAMALGAFYAVQECYGVKAGFLLGAPEPTPYSRALFHAAADFAMHALIDPDLAREAIEQDGDEQAQAGWLVHKIGVIGMLARRRVRHELREASFEAVREAARDAEMSSGPSF